MVIETSVLISAFAGLASFLSPCILPILPAFVSYLSGTTVNEVRSSSQRTETAGKIKGVNAESQNISAGAEQQRQQQQQRQQEVQELPAQLVIQRSTRL